MSLKVVYQSSTGFTKQYTEWVAEKYNCKALDIKNAKDNEINNCDCIVYGGWIINK